MLSYSIWFCAPSFWMGGRCVGRVYGADGAAPSAPHTQPTHLLPIQKLGAQNHIL